MLLELFNDHKMNIWQLSIKWEQLNNILKSISTTLVLVMQKLFSKTLKKYVPGTIVFHS